MIPSVDLVHPLDCGCTGCHPLQPALWSVYANLYAVNPEEALRAMREDRDPSLFDDPFIELELLMAALLASSYGVRAHRAKQVLMEALTPPLRMTEVEKALAEAEQILNKTFDEKMELEIRRLVNRLIIRGAMVADGYSLDEIHEFEPDIPLEETPRWIAYEDLLAGISEYEDGTDIDEADRLEEENKIPLVPAAIAAGLIIHHFGKKPSANLTGSVLSGNDPGGRATAIGRDTSLLGVPSANQMHASIVRAARYYTNTHFNRIILPEILRRAQLIANGADPSTVPGFSDINQYLSRRLASVPYWRLVANSAASRAFHYGMMKAGSLRQFRYYELVAVLDERTSDICRALDGRRFLLNETLDLLERMSTTEDPTEAERLLPWVPDAETVDRYAVSTDQLRQLGFVVPPFHPNCRTSIRFV